MSDMSAEPGVHGRMAGRQGQAEAASLNIKIASEGSGGVAAIFEKIAAPFFARRACETRRSSRETASARLNFGQNPWPKTACRRG